MDNPAGPQLPKIGGEANGEAREDVEDLAVLVVEDKVETVVGVVEEEMVLDRMIHLLVIAAGCVAIWPVTVPKRRSRQGVAMWCPPVELSTNPGTKAHEAEEEELGRSVSVASASCMTTRVTNTPSMMQDSCMCHLKWNTLLSRA